MPTAGLRTSLRHRNAGQAHPVTLPAPQPVQPDEEYARGFKDALTKIYGKEAMEQLQQQLQQATQESSKQAANSHVGGFARDRERDAAAPQLPPERLRMLHYGTAALQGADALAGDITAEKLATGAKAGELFDKQTPAEMMLVRLLIHACWIPSPC